MGWHISAAQFRYRALFFAYCTLYHLVFLQSSGIGDLVKQVRTQPVRPADGVVGCVYESFV
ncbi:hypothetical protein DXA34_12760, partial [[Clostridium] symbiosum]